MNQKIFRFAPFGGAPLFLVPWGTVQGFCPAFSKGIQMSTPNRPHIGASTVGWWCLAASLLTCSWPKNQGRRRHHELSELESWVVPELSLFQSWWVPHWFNLYPSLKSCQICGKTKKTNDITSLISFPRTSLVYHKQIDDQRSLGPSQSESLSYEA